MEELKTSADSRREVPMARATENDWRNRYQSLTGGRYGKTEPNYASEPGAGDEVNRGPDSPTTNRRYARERTPDDLPRRNQRNSGNYEPRSRRDRPPRSTSRSRSRSPERRRRSRRSPSYEDRRGVDDRRGGDDRASRRDRRLARFIRLIKLPLLVLRGMQNGAVLVSSLALLRVF